MDKETWQKLLETLSKIDFKYIYLDSNLQVCVAQDRCSDELCFVWNDIEQKWGEVKR